MHIITVRDASGKGVPVEVSPAVYQVYEEARKQKERERYERRLHMDSGGLNPLDSRGCGTSDPLEHVGRADAILSVLKTCTPAQRKRFQEFCLGYSCAEIAWMEHRSPSAVRKSLQTVLEKIRAADT